MTLFANKRFRLGIVGAGKITATGHLPGALASDHVEVAAIVDPVVERAQELIKNYGLSAVSSAEMTDVFDLVDGLVIATPNHTHHDIALKCIEAGKHCLIEKPLTTSLSDADDVVHMAEQRNIVVAVGYSTRFRDEVEVLKKLLEDRYFGDVKRFLYQFGTVGGWSPLSGYNLDRKASGGGVLVVSGSHFLDRILYWFGYPDRCEFIDDSRGGPEAHCIGTLHYRSGGQNFSGTLRFSKVVALKEGFVMETERGTVVLPSAPYPRLLFKAHDAPGIVQVLEPRDGPLFDKRKGVMQLEIENFVDACMETRRPMVDARQGRESVRLIADLYAAHTGPLQDWRSKSDRRGA